MKAGFLAVLFFSMEGKGNKTTSSDFCRIASAKTGEDVAPMIRSVSIQDVQKFVGSL